MSNELEVTPRPQLDANDPGRERELSAIVTNMWKNAEILARQELELGLKEIDLRVDKLKHSLLLGAIATLTVYAGILALLAAIVLGLSKVMEPWLAALIVGAVVTAAGVTQFMRSGDKSAEAAKADTNSHRTTQAMKEATK